eukprot:CAMPEP_0194311376 /NCGR_PEP_ID=MMETSP0171-20130528/8316_1 /TAXON_ID=218684 /ORGANISM="Corethron pennatum, Strain L29A3" /LENGTH=436 /DNA_ID=CAMNT_0039065425 /DNA_START=122 /DNA_END=1432 /DNA_ORIENTATION=-
MNLIKEGDRSHPELTELDALVLTYPRWEEDFETAEAAHLKKRIWPNFKSSLHTLRAKQCLHDGDRSHPRLVALDALAYTYPDFAADFQHALQSHLDTSYMSAEWDWTFNDLLETMHKKQLRAEHDRSHPELAALDALVLTFPGWEKGVDAAEAAHFQEIRWPNFRCSMHMLRQKQCLHVGDRSHPRLVALDALVYTYPDFEEDLRQAKRHHIETSYSAEWDDSFTDLLETMHKKQMRVDHDRSHPELAMLEALVLAYLGWEEDVGTAEAAHFKQIRWPNFRCSMHIMREKQCIHDGDRSHPRLMALDALAYTYPDFEEDLQHAKQHHLKTSYSAEWDDTFTDLLDTMKKKQIISRGALRPVRDPASPHRDDAHPAAAPVVPDLGLCTICLGAPKTHAFVPCGHVCACAACSKVLMARKTRCPFCRGKIVQSVQLFL